MSAHSDSLLIFAVKCRYNGFHITKNRHSLDVDLVILEDYPVYLVIVFITQLKTFLRPFQQPSHNIAYQCPVFMVSQIENRRANILCKNRQTEITVRCTSNPINNCRMSLKMTLPFTKCRTDLPQTL